MRTLAACIAVLLAGWLLAQDPASQAPPDYVCPMDPDVRATAPGRCPRCGMNLVIGVPDPIEYPVDLAVNPRAPKPGGIADLTFHIRDPKTGAPVTQFTTVHEKLFHLFLVSQDLEFFAHEHPVALPKGTFRYQAHLPKPGMYRVVADFYPTAGTPQLITRTLFAGGSPQPPPQLARDLSPKHAGNMTVELTTEPAQPIAGYKTMLFFRVSPADGLEPYLGAWCHMLAASDDLIDMIHTHPFFGDGGSQIQFNVIFPRARTYKLWVQFQRKGVVNTASFTVPVSVLQ